MSHTPTVTVAKNAGFCFGVARATKAVETEMADHPAGERIFTLGRLIHNEDYNRRLAAGGSPSSPPRIFPVWPPRRLPRPPSRSSSAPTA